MDKKTLQKGSEITKDTVIGEVLRQNSLTAEIMFTYGLDCVGCGGTILETIETGAKAHGISDKKIAEMVQEINNKIYPYSRNL